MVSGLEVGELLDVEVELKLYNFGNPAILDIHRHCDPTNTPTQQHGDQDCGPEHVHAVAQGDQFRPRSRAQLRCSQVYDNSQTKELETTRPRYLA